MQKDRTRARIGCARAPLIMMLSGMPPLQRRVASGDYKRSSKVEPPKSLAKKIAKKAKVKKVGDPPVSKRPPRQGEKERVLQDARILLNLFDS
jgi:hypothetical protein